MFTFASGVEATIERALRAAGGKDVHVTGAAETIHQASRPGSSTS
jgi:hypothetical protein